SSYIAIDNGIFEVSNNHVNVLSNDAMMAEDIDVARAKMDLERTERQKQNAKTREDLIKSEMEIVKLLNQIRVGEKRISE
ncbi:ATP synthase F1 subunit epsilon, partial [Turicibacter sanguinis]|nr:ATP synthase F1 subunit epsilon [Turicibacter sanguinis]